MKNVPNTYDNFYIEMVKKRYRSPPDHKYKKYIKYKYPVDCFHSHGINRKPYAQIIKAVNNHSSGCDRVNLVLWNRSLRYKQLDGYTHLAGHDYYDASRCRYSC